MSGHLLPLVGQNVPKPVIIAFTMGQINLDYWDENRQLVSESSLVRFSDYSEINTELRELKSFAKESLQASDSPKILDQFVIAFQSSYARLKKKEKYW